jgi:hypothetical protein
MCCSQRCSGSCCDGGDEARAPEGRSLTRLVKGLKCQVRSVGVLARLRDRARSIAVQFAPEHPATPAIKWLNR